MEIVKAVEGTEDQNLRNAFHSALGCLVRTLDLYGWASYKDFLASPPSECYEALNRGRTTDISIPCSVSSTHTKFYPPAQCMPLQKLLLPFAMACLFHKQCLLLNTATLLTIVSADLRALL